MSEVVQDLGLAVLVDHTLGMAWVNILKSLVQQNLSS